MTKEMYLAIIATLEGTETAVTREEIISSCKEAVERCDKRKSSKKSKEAQEETLELQKEILETLDKIAKPATIAEMLETSEILEGLSSQKMTSLLTPLVKEDKVVRTKDKKKTYFSVNPNVVNETEES